MTFKENMNPEVKSKWVAALRSGEYKQGPDVLKNSETGSFCCLGVLCDIYAKENGIEFNGPDSLNYIDEDLPPVVREWAGLARANPRLTINDDSTMISHWNDLSEEVEGLEPIPFAQLADAIEAQF